MIIYIQIYALHFSWIPPFFLCPISGAGRKVRIEGAEGAEGAAATPLEEFRRLLGQLEQQMLDGTGHGTGHGTAWAIAKSWRCWLVKLKPSCSYYIYPGLDNTYRKGRTWATVQIARGCFVQKMGLCQAFCSFIHFVAFGNRSEVVHFTSSFAFCSCICWVSWSIQHKISFAFCIVVYMLRKLKHP